MGVVRASGYGKLLVEDTVVGSKLNAFGPVHIRRIEIDSMI